MTVVRRTGLLALASLLTFALALSAFACGDDDDDSNGAPTATSAAGDPTQPSAPTEPASGATVSVQDNFFTPADLTVDAGTTVTWSFGGQLPHSVVGTYNGESIASDVFEGAGSFAFTFNAPGTFDYVCGIHGATMSGSVSVN